MIFLGAINGELLKVRTFGLGPVLFVILGCTGKKENHISQVNTTGASVNSNNEGELAIASAVVEGCLPVPGTPLPHWGSGRCTGNNKLVIPIKAELGGGALYYNSHSSADKGFSRGWRYSGQIEIDQLSTGLLAITLGDATRFEVSAVNGIFYSQYPGFRDVLFLVQQNTIEAQFNNGIKWHFSKSASGKFLPKDFIERDGSKACFEWIDDIISKITTADGDVVNFSRSGARVIGLQSSGKTRLILSYDFANRLERLRDFESSQFFAFKYGTNNLLLHQRRPDGGEEEFFYNPDGYLTEVIGANKFSKNLIYANDSVKVTDESTFITEKFRNGMVVEVNVDGIKTQIERSEAGLPMSITDVVGNITRLEHDLAGRVKKKIDQDGMVNTFDFDSRGRVVRKVRSRAGVSHEVITTYNENGDVMSSLRNGAGYLFERNQAGLVTKVTDHEGHVLNQFVYNDLGKVISSRDYFGNVTLNEFDTDGNLVAVTDPIGLTTRMEYDGEHRITAILRPDGVTERFVYAESGFGVQTITERAGVTISIKNSANLSASGILENELKNFEVNGKSILTATTSYGKLGELAKETIETCTATEKIDLVDVSQGNGLLPLRQDAPVP